jgi:hypothetical protein
VGYELVRVPLGEWSLTECLHIQLYSELLLAVAYFPGARCPSIDDISQFIGYCRYLATPVARLDDPSDQAGSDEGKSIKPFIDKRLMPKKCNLSRRPLTLVRVGFSSWHWAPKLPWYCQNCCCKNHLSPSFPRSHKSNIYCCRHISPTSSQRHINLTRIHYGRHKCTTISSPCIRASEPWRTADGSGSRLVDMRCKFRFVYLQSTYPAT